MLINQSDHVQLVTFVLGKDWLKQIILNHYFHFLFNYKWRNNFHFTSFFFFKTKHKIEESFKSQIFTQSKKAYQ